MNHATVIMRHLVSMYSIILNVSLRLLEASDLRQV
jgi:hypothetical protein